MAKKKEGYERDLSDELAGFQDIVSRVFELIRFHRAAEELIQAVEAGDMAAAKIEVKFARMQWDTAKAAITAAEVPE